MANSYQDFDNGSGGDWFGDNHPDVGIVMNSDPADPSHGAEPGGFTGGTGMVTSNDPATPKDAMAMRGPYTGGDVPLSQFGEKAPKAYQAFTDQFKGPDRPTDIDDKWGKTFEWDPTTNQDNPAFKQRMDLTTKGLQRSAAAKGNLLTGGTAAELQHELVGDVAQFQNEDFNRALQKYGSDYSTFTGDRQRRAGQYNQDFSNSRNAYLDKANIWNTNETNRYSTERSNRMDDFNIFDTDRNFNRTVSNDQWQRGNDLFGQNFDLAQFGRQLNRDNIGDLFHVYDNGLTAARSAADSGSRYGDSAGEDITGAGNAGAAGTVGGANAYSASLGNIGNAAMAAGIYRSSYGQRRAA